MAGESAGPNPMGVAEYQPPTIELTIPDVEQQLDIHVPLFARRQVIGELRTIFGGDLTDPNGKRSEADATSTDSSFTAPSGLVVSQTMGNVRFQLGEVYKHHPDGLGRTVTALMAYTTKLRGKRLYHGLSDEAPHLTVEAPGLVLYNQALKYIGRSALELEAMRERSELPPDASDEALARAAAREVDATRRYAESIRAGVEEVFTPYRAPRAQYHVSQTGFDWKGWQNAAGKALQAESDARARGEPRVVAEAIGATLGADVDNFTDDEPHMGRDPATWEEHYTQLRAAPMTSNVDTFLPTVRNMLEGIARLPAFRGVNVDGLVAQLFGAESMDQLQTVYTAAMKQRSAADAARYVMEHLGARSREVSSTQAVVKDPQKQLD